MLYVIFVDVRAACARVSELGLVGAMPEAVKLAHHVPQEGEVDHGLWRAVPKTIHGRGNGPQRHENPR